jgi:hypothetical protein
MEQAIEMSVASPSGLSAVPDITTKLPAHVEPDRPRMPLQLALKLQGPHGIPSPYTAEGILKIIECSREPGLYKTSATANKHSRRDAPLGKSSTGSSQKGNILQHSRDATSPPSSLPSPSRTCSVPSVPELDDSHTQTLSPPVHPSNSSPTTHVYPQSKYRTPYDRLGYEVAHAANKFNPDDAPFTISGNFTLQGFGLRVKGKLHDVGFDKQSGQSVLRDVRTLVEKDTKGKVRVLYDEEATQGFSP